MKNIYLKDPGNAFLPVYVPNENYAFYMNLQNPTNDSDFANFRLQLFNFKDELINANVGVLKQHFVDGGFYNIYCEFKFPAAKNREHYFVIKDVVKGVEKARSNYILVENEVFDLITQRIEYSSELNIDGYIYETLPGFKNIFRLPLSEIDYQFQSDKQQYRNITDNKLRTITEYRDNVIKIEAYYFDKKAHEAMASVVDHSSIKIGDLYYTAKAGYSVESSVTSSLTKGTFEAIEDPNGIEQEKPTATLVLNQNQLLLINSVLNIQGTASIDRGIANSYDFYKNGAQEPNQPQASNVHLFVGYTVAPGSNIFEVVVSYTLNNNSGIAKAKSEIEGVYPLRATTVDLNTSTPLPLISMKTGNNIQISLVPETNGQKQFFEIPVFWLNNRPLQQVQYYVNRLSKFEEVNKLNEYTVTDSSRLIEGVNVDYKKYTYNGLDRGQILIKLIF